MPAIKTNDGIKLYYKDWGTGQPVVFSHGWPLSADAFEDQMFYLASKGYRCIANDRRGHGRSDQSLQGNDMDTYADDLGALVDALDLSDVIHVGHSAGGGVIARYIGKRGTQRIAKTVLIGAVTPLMLKTEANPEGTPMKVFDDMRKNIAKDRSQFFQEFAKPFFGYNRLTHKESQGVMDNFWRQAMMTGLPACYEGIRAFSETDFTADLHKFDVPTLIMHGDDDQTVPIKGSAMQAVKLVKGATLKVYKGAPHGLCTTHKDEINEDLLSFIKTGMVKDAEPRKQAA